MAFEIRETGRGIPPRRVTNDELAREKGIETSDEWIRSHTGIGARHLAADDVAASDLATEAARNLLAKLAGSTDAEAIAREALTIDVIIVATASADFLCVPATACVVQNNIGAKNACAMDVIAGCTGFIYGLETASGLLSVNADRKRALVIGADVLSRFTDWTDRGTCILFGDGAGAALLEKTDAPVTGSSRRGIVRSIIGADGSGAENLITRRGGGRSPYKAGEVVDKPPHMQMNGQAVYNFAVKAITETVEEMFKREGITADDLRRIVPHQANARIVQAAAKRLKIPEEKFYLNIEEYANTSAATIPIALDELNEKGELARGDLVLTVGFGAGLAYGANLIVW